jgi:glycosyltransferase involved in cell wall biosynthesis
MDDSSSKVNGRRRLLALSAFAPYPLRNGYSLRVHHVLKRLSTSWDIVFLSPAEAVDWPVARQLEAWHHVDRASPGGGLASRPALESMARDVLRQSSFDAALVWGRTEFVADRLAPRFPPFIVDRIDSHTLHAWRNRRYGGTLRSRASAMRDVATYAMEEWRVVRRAGASIVVGQDDARVLRFLSRTACIEVIPNGCDVDVPPTDVVQDHPTVIFSGVLDYPPNVDAVRFFAAQTWPRVRRVLPDAEWIIAGASPGPAVRELAGLPGISIAADVEDMRTYLRKAWVAVAPMTSGSGIKNKVLEAWAVHRPVVMTRMASNGIALDPVSSELVTNSADEMADRIIALLSDAGSRQRYADRGYQTCVQQHSWDLAATRFNELLERIIPAQ